MVQPAASTRQIRNLQRQEIEADIQSLLGKLGETRQDSVPYDTTWIARLAAHYSDPAYRAALDWVRTHQLPDGSWGGEILHYHDRFACTLAALIALKTAGTAADQDRIRHATNFLWREVGRLHFDVDDTIAFSLLAVSLLREARNLGLDVPDSLGGSVAIIEKKLNLLGSNPASWRFTSMSFSLEAVPPYLPDRSAFESTEFILENGSIGTSPAATAAYLLFTQRDDPRLLEYLRYSMASQPDGGVPHITPAEVFEIGWGLHDLWLGNAISADDPAVKKLLDALWQRWSQKHGISCSSYFPVPDLDLTSTSFSLLKWGGYPVDVSVFEFFETPTHFRCYVGEENPSLSVNIRTLAATKNLNDVRVGAWKDKISAMLRRYTLDNFLLFDKWHVSPYYLTSTALRALNGVTDELLPSRVRWILRTQQADGGWGYYHRTTYEETALCLLALLYWDQHVERIDPAVLERGAQYLVGALDHDDMPALYIGKCLYNPRHVVQATILGALYAYLIR